MSQRVEAGQQLLESKRNSSSLDPLEKAEVLWNPEWLVWRAICQTAPEWFQKLGVRNVQRNGLVPVPSLARAKLIRRVQPQAKLFEWTTRYFQLPTKQASQLGRTKVCREACKDCHGYFHLPVGQQKHQEGDQASYRQTGSRARRHVPSPSLPSPVARGKGLLEPRWGQKCSRPARVLLPAAAGQTACSSSHWK